MDTTREIQISHIHFNIPRDTPTPAGGRSDRRRHDCDLWQKLEFMMKYSFAAQLPSLPWMNMKME